MQGDRTQIFADGLQALLHRGIVQPVPILERHLQAGAAVFRDRVKRQSFFRRQREKVVHVLDRELTVGGERLEVAGVGAIGQVVGISGKLREGHPPGDTVLVQDFAERLQHRRLDQVGTGFRLFFLADTRTKGGLEVFDEIRPEVAEHAAVAAFHQHA